MVNVTRYKYIEQSSSR